MKNNSFKAQTMKRTVCVSAVSDVLLNSEPTYSVGIVEVQELASRLIYFLVTLIGSSHTQRSIHVHVVTGKIQADKALKQESPSRKRGAKKDQQARSGATIRDHIEYRTEPGRLLEMPRGHSIQCIKQARHAVKYGACSRMKRHIVE